MTARIPKPDCLQRTTGVVSSDGPVDRRLSWSLVVAALLICGAAAHAQVADEKPAGESDAPATEAAGEDEPPLPKLSEMKIPEAEELIQNRPLDWVVLLNEDVLVVEPVSPRPDTLAKMEEELRQLANAKGKTAEEMEQIRQRRRDLLRLQVTLPEESEDPDYTIETRLIRQIIHHEDQVLTRAGMCVDEGKTALAFELLVYLDRRHHDWPGYRRLLHRLLLKESQLRLEGGDPEAAWRYAEELYSKDPKFEGLAESAGKIIDAIATSALEAHDYRRVRHFLRRLAARDAAHPQLELWRSDLMARTKAQLDLANAAAAEGSLSRAMDLVDEAARIWPETPGVKEAHREMSSRYPILRVGVLDLPTEVSRYPFPTWADTRWEALESLYWFEVNRFDGTGPKYRSVPCEAWEPDDLGRQLRFVLRRDRAEWETRPLLTSATFLAELRERTNRESEKYDERLAANILTVAAPTPFELMLRFRRPPLKPEALFRLPLTAAAESPSLNADLPPDEWNRPADSGDPSEQPPRPAVRFRMMEGEEGTLRAVRIRPEPPAIKQRHVAEIVERQYDDWDHLLQGLQRGEVSAVLRVKPIDLAALRDDGRYFVLPYSQPTSHLIQFHPRSILVKNGQLRRALLHAIPRGQILQEQILAGASSDFTGARLSASPFTTTTPEYNRLLPQPEHDPILSAGLAATARRQLGGSIPPLKITFPPEHEIREAVDAMIVQWKRVGIEVVPTNSADEDWDIAYRTVQFREPVVDLWPFFTLDPSSRVASLSPFPERIRRQLMELERATNWPGAIQTLHRLQTDLLVDAWWIPLWEIDEYCLFRRNVTGLPERFVTPYQDAERWIVQSWYPTEAP